jgi:hypothetical protein
VSTFARRASTTSRARSSTRQVVSRIRCRFARSLGLGEKPTSSSSSAFVACSIASPAIARPKRPRRRRFSNPGRTWAKTLERYRPGLVRYVLDELGAYYGRPAWQRRLDPTSELILTILTQNSADTNAEVAFEALRHRYPSDGVVQAHNPGAGWGAGSIGANVLARLHRFRLPAVRPVS